MAKRPGESRRRLHCRYCGLPTFGRGGRTCKTCTRMLAAIKSKGRQEGDMISLRRTLYLRLRAEAELPLFGRNERARTD